MPIEIPVPPTGASIAPSKKEVQVVAAQKDAGNEVVSGSVDSSMDSSFTPVKTIESLPQLTSVQRPDSQLLLKDTENCTHKRRKRKDKDRDRVHSKSGDSHSRHAESERNHTANKSEKKPNTEKHRNHHSSKLSHSSTSHNQSRYDSSKREAHKDSLNAKSHALEVNKSRNNSHSSSNNVLSKTNYDKTFSDKKIQEEKKKVPLMLRWTHHLLIHT